MARFFARAIPLVALAFLFTGCVPGVGGAYFYGAASQATANSYNTSSVVESVIVSDFNGFSHGNVYRLRNGQLWQQTEFYTWYRYWYYPSVIIYSSGGSYKMLVEGIDHPVTVRRVR